MQYRGIDVSETQGKISWEEVKLSKIEFAMIRATYGSSGMDIQFLNNIGGITKTNICVGVYHDLEAGSIGEAVREANYFLNTIVPYELLYPVAVNIESEMALQMGKDFFTSIVSAFIDVLKERSYNPLIYAGLEVLEYVDFSILLNVDIWLKENSSDISNGPSFKKNVKLWQYSDKGVVPGIEGNVNLDISYLDCEKKLNSSENGEIYMNENTTNNQSVNMVSNENSGGNTNEASDFYTVKNGDTLRSIAEKLFGNPEEYKRLMELNGLTRPVIFSGQILRIPNSENSGTFSYRVIPGDTLWKLAQRFLGYGPRYNEIMKENGLTNDMIYPGQILKIKIENNGNGSSPYIVKKGDTLWKIAQNTLGDGNRYSEIMKLNNLKDGTLSIGQPLIIPSN